MGGRRGFLSFLPFFLIAMLRDMASSSSSPFLSERNSQGVVLNGLLERRDSLPKKAVVE
jgi:hypothetical protein